MLRPWLLNLRSVRGNIVVMMMKIRIRMAVGIRRQLMAVEQMKNRRYLET